MVLSAKEKGEQEITMLLLIAHGVPRQQQLHQALHYVHSNREAAEFLRSSPLA